jgi:hypothetical protein
MAKRAIKSVPKKIKRTSSMEKCINEGENYLKATKGKRIVKTKTMMMTIAEGKRHLDTKIKRRVAIKPKTRPVRRAVKSKPALPAVFPPLFATVPSSVGATVYRASFDKTVKPTKATVFKTSSRDNLPLPAFGFIDVCFCVDATGSMASELAQVQSAVVSIIHKIQAKVRTEGITLRFAVVTYRDHPPQ